jgi:hypothetical protein
MSEANDNSIQVSTKYRWIENGHIFLWLIKDTCWAMVWKPGGIFMIFPTIAVAFYILWKSKHIRAELFHNLAVCFWILANSIWMAGEFFEKETRPYAVILFLAGLSLLIIYYIFFFKKDQAAIAYNLDIKE